MLFLSKQEVKRVNYQKLYTGLFNAITDAIDRLKHFEVASAREILIRAQQAAEEEYISSEEESD